MSENYNNKPLLTNIAIIRPILIVLLVFYHAFAIYSGAWEPIEGFPEISLYWWLDKLSYSFMLEMFVFVSGYVFGYQVRKRCVGILEAKALFWSKFMRLSIPSMVFSFLYLMILKDVTQPLSTSLYDVVNGVGHLWFLPMLFWCFAGTWLIEKLNLKPLLVLPLLLIFSLCSFVPLPLQMNQTLYYIFFFYFGYILQKNNIMVEHSYKPIYVVSLAILFAIIFPVLTIYISNSEEFILNGGGISDSLIIRILRYSTLKLSKLVYSSIGLAMFFLAIGYADKKSSGELPCCIVSFGGMCMGIYLLQQFILIIIYNFTSIPCLLGAYCLPWFGFIVTLVISTILVYLIRLTKIGRFLIG